MTKSERVLALLEALQDRPFLTGPEAAARLGVDVRTVRRDVAALQRLEIPVESERGPGGGYRLRPGYRMPPLMLTAAEATAVAIGLLLARRDGLDFSDAALAKIRRVLPDRIRLRVEALEQTLGFTAGGAEAPAPEGEHLLVLAEAAWRGRRVTGRYAGSDGTEAARELSPWGVVSHAGRWYVPAYDHDRRAPRTFRVDRFRSAGVGAAGTPAPAGFDAVAFVSRTLARVPWTHDIEVLLHTSPALAARHFPPTLAELEATGDDTVLRMRSESLEWVAGLLAAAGCDFTIRRPAALRDSVRVLAEGLIRASSRAPGT